MIYKWVLTGIEATDLRNIVLINTYKHWSLPQGIMEFQPCTQHIKCHCYKLSKTE